MYTYIYTYIYSRESDLRRSSSTETSSSSSVANAVAGSLSNMNEWKILTHKGTRPTKTTAEHALNNNQKQKGTSGYYDPIYRRKRWTKRGTQSSPSTETSSSSNAASAVAGSLHNNQGTRLAQYTTLPLLWFSHALGPLPWPGLARSLGRC